ncbi:hypothetical protein BGX24_008019, partial [Mortierella sp. AD032]
ATYFQGHEYLLADAVYALSQSVLSRYRSGEGDQVLFNSLHGSAQATIENAFGMLKLKFQSLQNLPIQINDPEDMDKVASWIMACVVLHNFVRTDAVEDIVDLRGIARLPQLEVMDD